MAYVKRINIAKFVSHLSVRRHAFFERYAASSNGTYFPRRFMASPYSSNDC